MTVQFQRMLSLVLSATLFALGCGGATSGTAARETTEARWTAAHLRKLDPELRSVVQRDRGGRFPVSVLFVELPSDEELEALALNRLGERVVGEVSADALLELAARDDVERIEMLADVGYETLK